MSEAKVLIKRRRRSIGALTMLLGALMAVSSLFFAATVASAHHPEYSASRLCDGSWSASADYVGGSEERLIIISGVTINGVPLTAGQTNGFAPYNPAVHGVTDPPASGLAWKGASSGFNIFSLAGSSYSSGWSGSITVYRPIGDVWFVGHGTSIYAPASPTDCETSTPTATNTVPPTATATATIVAHTATPTNTVPVNTPTPTKTTPPANTPTPTKTTPPANTPTPTKTTPPCTPPGTQTPTGGSTCTPTPTKTVPPTATPTTPPCTPPGTQTPTGGSTCTPTPPPATATPTTPPPATATQTNPPAGCYNGGGTPPAGAVTCTPTPVDSVAGVKTPGPGVPSAGTGFTGDLSSTNMVFALLGLLAVTAGAAFMAMGRSAEDE